MCGNFDNNLVLAPCVDKVTCAFGEEKRKNISRYVCHNKSVQDWSLFRAFVAAIQHHSQHSNSHCFGVSLVTITP